MSRRNNGKKWMVAALALLAVSTSYSLTHAEKKDVSLEKQFWSKIGPDAIYQLHLMDIQKNEKTGYVYAHVTSKYGYGEDGKPYITGIPSFSDDSMILLDKDLNPISMFSKKQLFRK